MVVGKLRQFLDGHGIKYVVISHSRAYTASEIAELSHTPGKELAKTVMVKADGNMAMAVVPASARVDMARLKDVTGATALELADEREFKDLFPGCETGAMPPFGNLYDMDVYVDQSLAEDEEIAFNAGSHTELIRLSYADFANVVKPTLGRFTQSV